MEPTSECNIQDVLNRGSDQVSATTSQTGASEDVDDIIPIRFRTSAHHDAVPCILETHIMIFIPES